MISTRKVGMETDSSPRGVTLTRRFGGYSVEWNGKSIGWLHASFGDKWNAYLRAAETGDSGHLLGRFTQKEAVRQIAIAAGWRETE